MLWMRNEIGSLSNARSGFKAALFSCHGKTVWSFKADLISCIYLWSVTRIYSKIQVLQWGNQMCFISFMQTGHVLSSLYLFLKRCWHIHIHKCAGSECGIKNCSQTPEWPRPHQIKSRNHIIYHRCCTLKNVRLLRGKDRRRKVYVMSESRPRSNKVTKEELSLSLQMVFEHARTPFIFEPLPSLIPWRIHGERRKRQRERVRQHRPPLSLSPAEKGS